MPLTKNKIRKYLLQTNSPKNILLPPFREGGFSPDAPKPAAVLLPLLQNAGAWHLLFIKRTNHLHDQHSGQVALPGGCVDDSDGDWTQTALREAEEEIGLNPSDVEVLGHLSSLDTSTNYRITPIVGQIPWPYPLILAKEEVSRTFTIPLAWLANPNNHETRPWMSSPGKIEPYPIIFFKEYKGEILWGASARMVVTLVKRLNVER